MTEVLLNKTMNKIAKMIVVGIMAFMVVMPSVGVAQAQQSAEIAPTQTVLQSQYNELIKQLISLLKAKIAELQAQLEAMKAKETQQTQPIQAETTAQAPVSAQSEVVLQPMQTVQAPATDAFSFSYEIAGKKEASIKLPSAPYTKADYWVKYKISNSAGNPFTVTTSGFHEGDGGADVSFTQKFLDKDLYTMVITATDIITKAQSSLTLSVDTR